MEDHWSYFHRITSFNPPIAFCTLPAALSVLPSVSNFLSPKIFPAASLTAPLACSAEPLISIFVHCRILAVCWGLKTNGVVEALFQIAWFWGYARLAYYAPCQLTFEHNRSDAPV